MQRWMLSRLRHTCSLSLTPIASPYYYGINEPSLGAFRRNFASGAIKVPPAAAKMKRKGTLSDSSPSNKQQKRSRPEVPEYHSAVSVRNEHGDVVWPAPKYQIERAREIILEWYV